MFAAIYVVRPPLMSRWNAMLTYWSCNGGRKYEGDRRIVKGEIN